MRTLTAWENGQPLARFTEEPDGTIGFQYVDNDPSVPVSLSLMPGGKWARRAPRNFLEGLLPQGSALRKSMARREKVAENDLFGLLAGADNAGGLTFSLDGSDPSSRGGDAVYADDIHIAAQIEKMSENTTDWWADNSHTRFSLNGNQPKFTLQYAPSLDKSLPQWVWPNAAYPSTHILKPPLADRERAGTLLIEAASSRLARLAGLPVTGSGIMSFANRQAFVIQRFDRQRRTDGSVTRLHAEDLLQALGLPPEDKYHVSAKRILTLLHQADPSDSLSYQWVRQLSFNVSINNVDAHAQNYSIILTHGGIRLSPMYDLLTTTYWPWVGRKLAMSIGGISGAAGVTRTAWQNLAWANNLDSDKVVEIAMNVAQNVVTNLKAAYSQVPAGVANRAEVEILLANRRMLNLSEKRIADLGFNSSVYSLLQQEKHRKTRGLTL